VWRDGGNENGFCASGRETGGPSDPSDRDGIRRDVARKHLVNRLNFINFKEESIIINLIHRKFGSSVTLRAKPLPCIDSTLECVWEDPSGIARKLNAYRIVNFVVPHDHNALLVEPVLAESTGDRILFHLPDSCREISSRKINRHRCFGVNVQFSQNGALFHGELVDFTPVSFRAEITSVPPQSFLWINQEFPVHVVFSNGKGVLYSGDCEIVKHDCGQVKRSYILRPLATRISRFKPKQFRSIRRRLVPSPNIIFTDPLTGKSVNLKVVDLSGSGFSVEERVEDSVLLPGRVIPDLSIDLANSMTFPCSAQVVYRNENADAGGRGLVTCGLAILDMDISAHVRLLALLQQATDGNSYVCARVDTDALWEFFFRTGFLYPRKYLHVQASKEMFKQTCEKLYTRNPHIARHFTFQKDGRINGHIAMVRFYENTWLVHHYAACGSSGLRAGLAVLEQAGRAINDSHGLYSSHMHFVACYFRPDKSFPRRIFGGIVDMIRDRQGCSCDAFAYLHFRKGACEEWDMTGPWSLRKTTSEDLRELESFYRHASGGLLLHALDLSPDMLERNGVSEEFHKAGMKKERHLFSLVKNDNLKAVFVISVSDIGLNMSELTNCIHSIIIDDEDFPPGTLFMMLSLLSKYYAPEEIPVLLYPSSYAERHGIAYENIYNLWILNMRHTDSYFRAIEKMLRHGRPCKEQQTGQRGDNEI